MDTAKIKKKVPWPDLYEHIKFNDFIHKRGCSNINLKEELTSINKKLSKAIIKPKTPPLDVFAITALKKRFKIAKCYYRNSKKKETSGYLFKGGGMPKIDKFEFRFLAAIRPTSNSVGIYIVLYIADVDDFIFLPELNTRFFCMEKISYSDRALKLIDIIKSKRDIWRREVKRLQNKKEGSLRSIINSVNSIGEERVAQKIKNGAHSNDFNFDLLLMKNDKYISNSVLDLMITTSINIFTVKYIKRFINTKSQKRGERLSNISCVVSIIVLKHLIAEKIS